MQEAKASSLLREAPRLFDRVLSQLFDDEPVHNDHRDVTLLTPQPAKQRRLFLQQAVQRQLRVMLQVVPASQEGYPENIHGRIKPLSRDRYLVVNHNLSYVVGFDQIRYLAHLDQDN